MHFEPHTRNEFGKCDAPSRTLERIQQGLEKLELTADYSHFQVAENLHWGRIRVDQLNLSCEGKGVTPELSRASAYAELAERFSSGLFFPEFEEKVRFHLPYLLSQQIQQFLNFEWMPGYVNAHQEELDNPLTVEELLKLQSQLPFETVQQIKQSRMCRHWVEGYSLLQQKTLKVPLNFAAYIHGSNGLAAGNTLEEALIQASCEIFERYAQLNTIKPEQQAPTIPAEAFQSRLIRDLISFYHQNRVQVLIKDLSLRGLLPVLGVLYINRNLQPGIMEYRQLIAGASFDLEHGLTRCLTEGIQGRRNLTSPRPGLNKPVLHPLCVDDYYPLLQRGVCPKDISFLEHGDIAETPAAYPAKDLLQEIEQIKKICQCLNTDCIVLDHTHPVLQFPVVRVIMPGISDILPYLKPDVLTANGSRPQDQWRGKWLYKAVQSFFPAE